ncbi:hypothetical protein CASFOL_013920 [Castilleja foliolosa]|uniref:RRM domain-containing protein n=1 Tax=Castilleja foliolosa TaxID=1961234 RepID=A0ABD3DQF8_9LAMI
MSRNQNSVFYATTYHPIQAGSIDGTDILPHDNAVYRALLCSNAALYDSFGDPKVNGDPYCTLFVARLSHLTTEDTLAKAMKKYGMIKNLRLVRHIVTGASRGYAFVEFETEKEMRRAYKKDLNSDLELMESHYYYRCSLCRGTHGNGICIVPLFEEISNKKLLIFGDMTYQLCGIYHHKGSMTELESEYVHFSSASCYRTGIDAHHTFIDDSEIIVDYNRQHLMPGWIPRRLGGGLGGKKESGQLRFGGRERPFRAPLYMSRFQIPSPPRRKRSSSYETEDFDRLGKRSASSHWHERSSSPDRSNRYHKQHGYSHKHEKKRPNDADSSSGKMSRLDKEDRGYRYHRDSHRHDR